MGKAKKAIILLVILAATAACGLILELTEDKAENETAAGLMAADIGVGRVLALAMKNESGSIGLLNLVTGIETENGNSEIYDQNKLKTLIYSLAHLNALRELKAPFPAGEDYGLTAPSAQCSLLLEDDTIRLYLGRRNPVTGEYYLKRDGSESVFMIGEEDAKLMLQSVQDLRILSVFPPINADTVGKLSQIKIESGESVIKLSQIHAGTVNTFYEMVEPVSAMLDWKRVDEQIISPLKAFQPEHFVSDDVPLREYGLDKPDFVVELLFGGKTYRCGFTRKDPDSWYCADLAGTLVSEVSAERTGFLKANFLELIGGSIYTKSVADIDGISLKYGGERVVLDIEGEGSALTAETGGRQMDYMELLDFYRKMSTIPAAGVLDGSENIDTAPLLVITLGLRSGGADILEFYPISDRRCAVYINGAAEFSTYTPVVTDIAAAADKLR